MLTFAERVSSPLCAAKKKSPKNVKLLMDFIHILATKCRNSTALMSKAFYTEGASFAAFDGFVFDFAPQCLAFDWILFCQSSIKQLLLM